MGGNSYGVWVVCYMGGISWREDFLHHYQNKIPDLGKGNKLSKSDTKHAMN